MHVEILRLNAKLTIDGLVIQASSMNMAWITKDTQDECRCKSEIRHLYVYTSNFRPMTKLIEVIVS